MIGGKNLLGLNSVTGTSESTQLVIVGAGIAGLAAAKTLETLGFHDYLLLEAESVAGGRCRWIAWDDGWLELGAQFLHGDQSDLAQVCLEKDLVSATESWEGEGAFVRDDGIEITDRELLRRVKEIVDCALDECQDYCYAGNEKNNILSPANVGAILKATFSKHLKMRQYDESVAEIMGQVFDWHMRFLLIDNACTTMEALSAKKWPSFQAAGGPEYLVLKEGYKSFVESTLSELKQENVRFNSPVVSIVRQSEEKAPILIILSDNRQIVANCAIVTCSLGYLKKQHAQMFWPGLPSNLTGAIEKLGFGLINKIFLDFGEQSWWEENAKGFQLIWRRAREDQGDARSLASWTRDISGFDVLSGCKAVLLGWVGGRGAYTVENISEGQIMRDCVSLLRRFLKRRDIPEAKKCVRTRWYSNEYVIGGYSHIPTDCDEAGVSPADLLEPVWSQSSPKQKRRPLIMLAGEAASDRYYSTTHGAYETGVRQAQIFFNSLSS